MKPSPVPLQQAALTAVPKTQLMPLPLQGAVDSEFTIGQSCDSTTAGGESCAAGAVLELGPGLGDNAGLPGGGVCTGAGELCTGGGLWMGVVGAVGLLGSEVVGVADSGLVGVAGGAGTSEEDGLVGPAGAGLDVVGVVVLGFTWPTGGAGGAGVAA